MILVIGATGTAGLCVCRELDRAGLPYSALSRNATRAASRLPPGTRVVQGDLSRPRQVRSALEGVDTVFLATPANRHMLEWQCAVIDTSRALGVRKIIKLSGPHIDGEAPARLRRIHAQIETCLQRSGLDYCVLRASPFMQNILLHADTVRKEGMLYAAIGDGEIGFVDAWDVARLVVRCLRDHRLDREVLDVTGRSVASGYELARRLTVVTRRRIEYVPIPVERLLATMQRLVRDHWLIEAMAELYVAYANNEGRFVSNDYRRIMGADSAHVAQFITHRQTAFI